MFEVLIREAAVRFRLGDKALQVLQMLLAQMTSSDQGGLVGFLDKFKAAGLGPIVQSWLGGGPSAQPIGNSQLEAVLGASGGLPGLMSAKLDLAREDVTSAIGYLLPMIVGKLTPGGSIPSGLPDEVNALAAAGQALLARPAMAAATRDGGSLIKWLPWAVVVLAILFGLSYLGKDKGAAEPSVEPAPAAQPAQEAASAAVSRTLPASEPAVSASAQESAGASPAQDTAPSPASKAPGASQ